MSFVMREALGRVLLRAGWAGAVGVILLVLAALLAYRSEVSAEVRRVALAQERARVLQERARPAPRVDDAARLEAFYAGFPPPSDLPGRIRRLDDIAADHGVRLQRTDFRSAVEGGTPLLAVGLVIPVSAALPDVYGWLAEALQEMPELALESLVLRRESTDSDSVEADVRLQFYLRGRT